MRTRRRELRELLASRAVLGVEERDDARVLAIGCVRDDSSRCADPDRAARRVLQRGALSAEDVPRAATPRVE